MMNMSEKVLEFSIFCIENLAQRMDMNPRDTYDLLTKKTDLLREYIVPSYDALHTQDKEYIIDDILNALEMKGIAVA